MKVFLPINTKQHAPEYEVDNGRQIPAFEIPARAEAIRCALEKLQFVAL